MWARRTLNGPKRRFSARAVSTGITDSCEDRDFATLHGADGTTPLGAAGVTALNEQGVSLFGLDNLGSCPGLIGALVSLSEAFTCDDDVAPYRAPLLNTAALTLPTDITNCLGPLTAVKRPQRSPQ